MDLVDLATAKGLETDIDKISAVQAQNATSGAKIHAVVVDPDGKIINSEADLRSALGDAAYNTLCTNTMTALNTALASTKTAKNTALAAL